MLISTALAAVCWLAMGLVSRQYQLLLAAAVALNIFMVIASTVMGGLMVEAGQRYDAAGRITSLRQTVQSVGSLINGVLGGFLATIAFGWTAGAGAFLLFILVPLTSRFLREQKVAQRDTACPAQRLVADQDDRQGAHPLVGRQHSCSSSTWPRASIPRSTSCRLTSSASRPGTSV